MLLAKGTRTHPRWVVENAVRCLYLSLCSWLPVIVKEMELTACQPREVCVEVAKEYVESTSHFFVPRCVSVHRCGGCCYHEGQECTNTSYTLVEKTVRICKLAYFLGQL